MTNFFILSLERSKIRPWYRQCCWKKKGGMDIGPVKSRHWNAWQPSCVPATPNGKEVEHPWRWLQVPLSPWCWSYRSDTQVWQGVKTPSSKDWNSTSTWGCLNIWGPRIQVDDYINIIFDYNIISMSWILYTILCILMWSFCIMMFFYAHKMRPVLFLYIQSTSTKSQPPSSGIPLL